MNSEDVDERWVPLAEAARELGISVPTARRWLQQGALLGERRAAPHGHVWWVRLERRQDAVAKTQPAGGVDGPLIATLLRELQTDLVRKTEAAALWRARAEHLARELEAARNQLASGQRPQLAAPRAETPPQSATPSAPVTAPKIATLVKPEAPTSRTVTSDGKVRIGPPPRSQAASDALGQLREPRTILLALGFLLLLALSIPSLWRDFGPGAAATATFTQVPSTAVASPAATVAPLRTAPVIPAATAPLPVVTLAVRSTEVPRPATATATALPATPTPLPPTATPPPPTATPSPGVYQAVANTRGTGLVLRSNPSSSAAAVATYSEGTVLRLLGPEMQSEGRTWRFVQSPDGRQGWVSSEFLQPASEPAPSGSPTVLQQVG